MQVFLGLFYYQLLSELSDSSRKVKIWVYIFDGRGGGPNFAGYEITGTELVRVFFIVNLNSIFLTLRLTEACYVHEEKKIVKVIATISYNSYQTADAS